MLSEQDVTTVLTVGTRRYIIKLHIFCNFTKTVIERVEMDPPNFKTVKQTVIASEL